MLALVWIALVHIFFNHFAPGVFPMNMSIFTGKVSKERYQEEHPLEYERLVRPVEEPTPTEQLLEYPPVTVMAEEPNIPAQSPEAERVIAAVEKPETD